MRRTAQARCRSRATSEGRRTLRPMFDTKTTFARRLTDAVDPLIDFATLGEYAPEPVGRLRRAASPAAARSPPVRAPRRRTGAGGSRDPLPNNRGPPRGAASKSTNRRRPTLPGPCEPSTIGAEGLNCSVRNGKRCFPLAIATGNFARPAPAVPQNCTAPHNGYQKYPSSPRPISTSLLQSVTALPELAYQPGGLPGVLLPLGDGRAHLEVGFPLRCFQRLSNPDVANLRCRWHDNRYTRGLFIPVLSY